MGINARRILVFGAGQYYQRYHQYIADDEIIAVLDNSEKLWGKYIDGHIVMSPEEGVKLPFDKIVIMSRYVNEMTEQLLKLGVEEDKLIYPFEIEALFRQSRSKIYNIVLISDDLKTSGAQLALLYMAKILQKHGYGVRVLSPYGGTLQDAFQRADIPVLIDNTLLIKSLNDIDFVDDADLIIMNTSLLYSLVIGYARRIPIIWWIHECEHSYRWIISNKMSEICSPYIKIFSVSDVADRSFYDRNRGYDIQRLPIGIPDVRKEMRHIRHDKTIFLIVGEICELKGHDIVLDALQQLNADENSRIEVWLVGRSNSEIQGDLIDRLSCVDNIKILGEVANDDMDDIYANADVLICSSRMESFSIVVLEAMQRNIPAIVSSAAGICAFLHDNVDSLIFGSENSNELADKMRLCIEKPSILEMIKKNAYLIYRNGFSIDVFEKNVISIVNKTIEESLGDQTEKNYYG